MHRVVVIEFWCTFLRWNISFPFRTTFDQRLTTITPGAFKECLFRRYSLRFCARRSFPDERSDHSPQYLYVSTCKLKTQHETETHYAWACDDVLCGDGMGSAA